MRQRIVYLDLLRCLAIGLVIALHTITPVLGNTSYYGIPSWYLCMLLGPVARAGVPLFFMLSGYLLLSRDGTAQFSGFYRKNLPKLAVPLLVWNLVYYLDDVLRLGRSASVEDFLGLVLNQGVRYHMWFVYAMLGIYLLCPFLKRIADGCTDRQLLLLVGLILFPTTLRPLLNTVQPVHIFLFDPLMNGYLGYFLLGHCLGRWRPGGRARALVYLGGVMGYLIGAVGNLATASAENIPLPCNGGFGLNHYLTASAIFVLTRAVFARYGTRLKRLSRPLAWLSERTFSVYWVHVLVLDWVTQDLGGQFSVLEQAAVQMALTTVLSFGLAAGFASLGKLFKALCPSVRWRGCFLALLLVAVAAAPLISCGAGKSCTVPVLLYHEINADGQGGACISKDCFLSHLDALRAAGYHTVTVPQMIDFVKYGTPLPEKPVAITFDDGYLSNYEIAWPELARRDMNATIFVIGASVGQQRGTLAHFTFAQAREMSASGVISIQSHTYDMHQCDPMEQTGGRVGVRPLEGEVEADYRAALRRDLERSVGDLRRKAQLHVRALAYPYGVSTPESEQAAADLGLEATFTTKGKPARLRRGDPDSLRLVGRYSIDDCSPEKLLEILDRAPRDFPLKETLASIFRS